MYSYLLRRHGEWAVLRHAEQRPPGIERRGGLRPLGHHGPNGFSFETSGSELPIQPDFVTDKAGSAVSPDMTIIPLTPFFGLLKETKPNVSLPSS